MFPRFSFAALAFSVTAYALTGTTAYASTEVQLTFTTVEQSSDSSASTTAENVTDDSMATYSLTDDLAGSYWMAEMGRPFEMNRIEIVNRSAPDDVEMAGLTLSLFNMDDQLVFETVLSNPGSEAVAVINLPADTKARSIRIGLDGTDTNGAGNYRVGFSKVKSFGVPNIPFLPEPFIEEEYKPSSYTVEQSNDLNSSYPADNAVDDNSGSFSHTDNSSPGNYWMADLEEVRPITSVEILNRNHNSTAIRLEGLTLKILDESSNTVASTITTNPGAGETYTYTPPANTSGRYVWIGLEGDNTNGRDDYVVCLAEVAIYDGAIDWLSSGALPPLPNPTDNLARSQKSYMLKIADTDPPASKVNDGYYSTETRTTSNAFDGYWEVDLGTTHALYGIRAIAPNDLKERLGYTIARLYDEEHNSVHSQNVTGSSNVYDIDLNGPIFARYVRIGLENKTRPNETNTTNKYEIGFNEVEVFGRPVSEVGIMSFNTSDTTVSFGKNITLDWSVVDVKRAEIHPSVGSVGTETKLDGTGDLIQNMTESTEFIMLAKNSTDTFTRAVSVEVDGSPLSVHISELVADNKYSLKDGYGGASDWIELRNTSNHTIELTGWGLSDNPSNPMKWVFPPTSMPPHSTLVVFASGDEVPIDPAGMLHADFSLSANGETIQLTSSDGSTIIDSMTYPELDKDLAYGRGLNGELTHIEPTPNTVNTGTTYSGWLESLNWSHARGFYETNFTLKITSDNPSATILYSLDGSEPSIPYTTGLIIDETTIVRIQSVQSGYRSPSIQTKTFIFLDDVTAGSNMDTGITQDPAYTARIKPGLLALPSISIAIPTTPDYPEQMGSMEILWGDEQSPIQVNCGVSVYGGAVQTFAKDSIQLAFRSKYGDAKLNAPLFSGFDRGGFAAKTSFDKLQLHAGNQDRKTGFYMSDRFVQDSLLEMGSLNPHGRYIHVYLNGEYWGQYNCKEMLNDSFLANYLGGEPEDYVDVKGNNNDRTGIGWSLGIGAPPDVEPWERVRDLRGDFVAVSPYLDVSHYIDVMLVWGYGYCEQEFKASGPMEAGSGYKFWLNDTDRFLRDGSGDRIENTRGPGYIWQGLHDENHPDFKMLVADRIYKNFFNDGAMTPAACDARLAKRMDEIRDSFLAEAARWGYVSPSTWETKGAAIRADMFPFRTGELIAHWRSFGYLPSIDPPSFNLYGGAVAVGFVPTLKSSDGTIYYSLNGTDPRMPGGALNPSALTWSSGAVSVSGDVIITTRVRASDGTWSALAEPRFALSTSQPPLTGDLLVTEINYNPDGSDDYEFIELWNSGKNPIDLTDVSISDAVIYIFPEFTTLNPGEHIVVVEDAVAFADRYQNPTSPWYWDGIQVSGEWVGGLGDGGETISLLAADSSLITECSYRSYGEWPGRPDGGGSSLQVNFPTLVPTDLPSQFAYLSDAKNWGSSALYHGSPGRFEPAGNGVVINEVLAHTDVGVDWIEMYNPTGDIVDLTGLGLTDDMDQPNRYVFPNGTSIGAYGYLTISASTFGYGFSELGSEAALLELSGSNIIRIVDRVDFPAVNREEAFGRHQRSDGEINFTELTEITPGAENAMPRVGPVVISEIQYAPQNMETPYIEIMNISSDVVPLYDVNIPSNTWSLSGVGNFDFPAGVILEPGETALLSPITPDAFRTEYGLDQTIQVFGPWLGSLDLDGEKLKLLSPGDPEPDGFVPMYRADHVAYSSNELWPDAITTGNSIDRHPLTGYGNDPANWSLSPGVGSPGFFTEYLEPFTVTLSTFTDDDPSIIFPTLYGHAYNVYYTDSLSVADWKVLLTIPFATSNSIEVSDPTITGDTRFYKIDWQTQQEN
ncbi:lamin tail domain-containing protein [bacterium]|nr:lamin tail domain-containing protein [bacterium]